MASSKGNNVSSLGTYFAPAVSSVALRVHYVDLESAVHQAIWYVQESVRCLSRFSAFLVRSHTSLLQVAQMA